MPNKIVGIAINDYMDKSLGPLSNCINDINTVVEILSKFYGFNDIELLTQKIYTSLSYIHNRLYDILINSMEEDRIIIVFAGHGEYIKVTESTYWLAYDSKLSDSSTWFNLATLMDFMRASKAKHICLISDSCFAGAIFENKMRGGGISTFEDRVSRYALTSGSVERVSDGCSETENLSPFIQTLVKALNENKHNEYLFTTFSEYVISSFEPIRKQTPRCGALTNAGHKGGCLILRKDEIHDKGYQDINLVSDWDPETPMSINCTVPVFHKSKNFNNEFINSYIQHLGYDVLNDVKKFLHSDRDYFSMLTKSRSISLDLSYEVKKFDENFISIIIQKSDFFGSFYPNYHVYTLNFALKPERKITLSELIHHEEFEDFLVEKIKKHSSMDGEEEFLFSYAKQMDPNTVDFSINEESITIYMLNEMPHAIQALGSLEIPFSDLTFKS